MSLLQTLGEFLMNQVTIGTYIVTHDFQSNDRNINNFNLVDFIHCCLLYNLMLCPSRIVSENEMNKNNIIMKNKYLVFFYLFDLLIPTSHNLKCLTKHTWIYKLITIFFVVVRIQTRYWKTTWKQQIVFAIIVDYYN